MSKTLLLCDSACDLSQDQEKKLGIRVVNCGVELGGLPYVDRAQIDSAKIYAAVAETGELPHTSQVTVIQFLEEFVRAAKEGYTDILCATMNAKGSGTHSAALHAASVLAVEYPALSQTLRVRVLDSTTYSYPIALPLLKAAQDLKKGADPDEVADAVGDFYQNQLTLVGLYSLDYAAKSGRLNACAAFVGEILGLKPIMSIQGENRVLDKVRGAKNLIPKMAQLYIDHAADPNNGEYIVAYGDNPDQAKELVSAIKKLGGKSPALMGPIGPCVAVNAGPKMLGLGFRRK